MLPLTGAVQSSFHAKPQPHTIGAPVIRTSSARFVAAGAVPVHSDLGRTADPVALYSLSSATCFLPSLASFRDSSLGILASGHTDPRAGIVIRVDPPVTLGDAGRARHGRHGEPRAGLREGWEERDLRAEVRWRWPDSGRGPNAVRRDLVGVDAGRGDAAGRCRGVGARELASGPHTGHDGWCYWQR